MTKILIVDDETDLEILIKQRFRQKIRDHEFEFVFAINGFDALEKVKDHPDIAMVLTDINMPEMDGLTLLTKLNEVNPLIKTVIVSAYGDMENIRIAMNLGAFDFITKPINFEDLTLTIAKTLVHVKLIGETLKAIKENNILKMYVDENVLKYMGGEEFEKGLDANETISATVAFIDICRFTAISEHAPANTVVNLLNSYFDMMVKEILDQGGEIDKFIGDSIMAVFRGNFHLDRAIDASLRIRAQVAALPSVSELFSPRVSIGINSGEMISGNIGSVSLRRLDFTVIGDAVNTAQRLQSVAEEGQIIINETSYNLVKESFNCHKVSEVNLKNKSRPVTIYEVLD